MLKKVLTSKMILTLVRMKDAIQQELFDNIMEISFENVILSKETREVPADIYGYIAKVKHL